MVAVISGSGMAAFVSVQLRSEEGWHHEIFVPDPVYRVRDFFNSWEITSNELKSPPVRILS